MGCFLSVRGEKLVSLLLRNVCVFDYAAWFWVKIKGLSVVGNGCKDRQTCNASIAFVGYWGVMFVSCIASSNISYVDYQWFIFVWYKKVSSIWVVLIRNHLGCYHYSTFISCIQYSCNCISDSKFKPLFPFGFWFVTTSFFLTNVILNLWYSRFHTTTAFTIC